MISFKLAAIKILQIKKESLHYRDITKLALEQKLIKTNGTTPQNTMYAQITKDIQQNKEKSAFIKVGPGIFKINPISISIGKIQENEIIVNDQAFLELCNKFPLFEKIGQNKFRSKLWILLRLLQNKEGMLDDHFGSIKCSSLRTECKSFNDIIVLVNELHKNGLINRNTSFSNRSGASLTGNTGFVLTDFLDEVQKKTNALRSQATIHEILKQCDPSFEKTDKLNELRYDGGNLKEKFYDLLDISVKGCLDACFRIILDNNNF